jgi:alkylation response protein AidB-like acyl-CoA dehydrogenase
VKTRSFGLHESLSHHPPTQQAIGEMATAIRAARGLLREAALTKMRDDRAATVLAVNQSKYFSAEVRLSQSVPSGSRAARHPPIRWSAGGAAHCADR